MVFLFEYMQPKIICRSFIFFTFMRLNYYRVKKAFIQKKLQFPVVSIS